MEEFGVFTVRKGESFKLTDIFLKAFKDQENGVLERDLKRSKEENLDALKFYIEEAGKCIVDDFNKHINLFEYLGKIYYICYEKYKGANEILDEVTTLRDRLIENWNKLESIENIGPTHFKKMDSYTKEELEKIWNLIATL